MGGLEREWTFWKARDEIFIVIHFESDIKMDLAWLVLNNCKSILLEY